MEDNPGGTITDFHPRRRLAIAARGDARHPSGVVLIVHAFWRLRISEMISSLVCSGVMLELFITVAPSAIIRGAAARWLSRWSRAARFSETPSASRRLVRSLRQASR